MLKRIPRFRMCVFKFVWFGIKSALLLVTVLTIAFLLFNVLPADPVRSALGVHASEDAVRALEKELGYDRGLFERYQWHLRKALTMDFGPSLLSRRPVIAELLPAMKVTVIYSATALFVSSIGSLFLVIVAYFSSQSVRFGLLGIAKIFTSAPSIVVSVVIGMTVISSGIIRVFVDLELESFVTAVLALSVYPLFSLTEIGISESNRAGRLGYVAAARSFGFSRVQVFSFFVFRSVLVPWLGHLSNLAAAIFVGSAVIEIVFSLPGLGQLLVRSVAANDFPMLQALVVITVVMFVMLNLIFDRFVLGTMSSPRKLSQ